jgi:hypothetical protein
LNFGSIEPFVAGSSQPVTTFDLQVSESISAQGYVALVKLAEFARSIRADDGRLRKTLFDACSRLSRHDAG